MPHGTISPETAAWFEKNYGLKIQLGQRIRYTGDKGRERFGIIVGTDGGRLLVQLDGARDAEHFHPMWKIEVIPRG